MDIDGVRYVGCVPTRHHHRDGDAGAGAAIKDEPVALGQPLLRDRKTAETVMFIWVSPGEVERQIGCVGQRGTDDFGRKRPFFEE